MMRLIFMAGHHVIIIIKSFKNINSFNHISSNAICGHTTIDFHDIGGLLKRVLAWQLTLKAVVLAGRCFTLEQSDDSGFTRGRPRIILLVLDWQIRRDSNPELQCYQGCSGQEYIFHMGTATTTANIYSSSQTRHDESYAVSWIWRERRAG